MCQHFSLQGRLLHELTCLRAVSPSRQPRHAPKSAGDILRHALVNCLTHHRLALLPTYPYRAVSLHCLPQALFTLLHPAPSLPQPRHLVLRHSHGQRKGCQNLRLTLLFLTHANFLRHSHGRRKEGRNVRLTLR